MPGAATAHVLLSLLSAAAAVAPGGDSDRAGTVGAATRTERCAAQRTTSGTGVHDASAPPAGLPESDPGASGDARDCSPDQAATDDRDRHLFAAQNNRVVVPLSRMSGGQRVPGWLADQGHRAVRRHVNRHRLAALPVEGDTNVVATRRNHQPTRLPVPDTAVSGAIDVDLEPAQEEPHGPLAPDDDDACLRHVTDDASAKRPESWIGTFIAPMATPP